MSIFRRLCVLLLEDDDADAYLTSRALLNLPRVADVVRARNGQQAVSLLASGQVAPDIAFVDLQMPTMDGLKFLETTMSERLANVPLIVLTSSSDWKDATRSRVNGALAVITKPDNPVELARLLDGAIQTFVPDAPSSGQSRKVFEFPRDQPPPASRPSNFQLTTDHSPPQFGRRQSGRL